jgi:hypothetical protein
MVYSLLTRHREIEPLLVEILWSASLAAASISICTHLTVPLNSRVEAVVPETICRQTFCSWGSARSTENTRRTKTHIIKEDQENVRCTGRWV